MRIEKPLPKLLPALVLGAFALAGCGQLQAQSNAASSSPAPAPSASPSAAPSQQPTASVQPSATQTQPPAPTTAQPPATTQSANQQQTERVVLTPTTSAGAPSAGWTVSDQTAQQIDCGNTSALRPGQWIPHGCSPAAAWPAACYVGATPTQALCVGNPWQKQLNHYTLTQSSDTTKVDPEPIALDLADGKQCQLRVGGAWGAPHSHPDWDAYWGCDGNVNVIAPSTLDSTEGIDESTSPAWTVTLDSSSGPSRTATVVRAYYPASE